MTLRKPKVWSLLAGRRVFVCQPFPQLEERCSLSKSAEEKQEVRARIPLSDFSAFQGHAHLDHCEQPKYTSQHKSSPSTPENWGLYWSASKCMDTADCRYVSSFRATRKYDQERRKHRSHMHHTDSRANDRSVLRIISC